MGTSRLRWISTEGKVTADPSEARKLSDIQKVLRRCLHKGGVDASQEQTARVDASEEQTAYFNLRSDAQEACRYGRTPSPEQESNVI